MIPAPHIGRRGLTDRQVAVARAASGGHRIVGLSLDGTPLTRAHSLCLPAGLPFETWKKIGTCLSKVATASAWWLGDWLVYGESRYPDRYKKVVEETSLEYQTLRNYAWVARSVDLSRRRDSLSFQHHAEVAALPAEQQDEWLDRAARFGWSRNQLRQYLNVSRSPSKREATAAANNEPVGESLVQVRLESSRQQTWQKAADLAGCTLTQWMVRTLDEAAGELTEPEGEPELGSGSRRGKQSAHPTSAA